MDNFVEIILSNSTMLMKRLYPLLTAASLTVILAHAATPEGSYLANLNGTLYNKGWNRIETPMELSTQADGAVEIRNFILPGFTVTGSYNPGTETITIPGPAFGQYIKSYDEQGNPVMADCATQNSSDVSDSNDIILKVDASKRQVRYEAEMQWFEPDMIHDVAGEYAVESLDLFRVDSQGRLAGYIGYTSYLELNAVNATISYSSVDSSGKPYTDKSYAYIETDEAQSHLTVRNAAPVFTRWFFDMPVTLNLDMASMTATATDAIVAGAGEGPEKEFLLWSIGSDGKFNDNTLTFSIENIEQPEGMRTLIKTGAMGIATKANPGQSGMVLTDVCFSPDFALAAGARVDNIESSDAVQAPVGYFNLQGIRVSEPSTGFYIRRQGHTVTKVLLK